MSEPVLLAKTIWDYCCLHHPPDPAELMFIFGCHNLRLADRAAELFRNGYSSKILVSGGWGAITRSLWQSPEAHVFKNRLIDLHIPAQAILVEDQASTVRDNIIFGQKVLENNRLTPRSFLLITQPFSERRVLGAAQKVWHDARISITSPQISFENYPNEYVTPDDLICLLAGEVHRLSFFFSQGWCAPSPIPEPVSIAARTLINLGYTKYIDLSLYPNALNQRRRD